MKRMFVIAVALLSLTACGIEANGDQVNEFDGYLQDKKLRIYKDKETGCEYMMIMDGSSVGITPRYSDDGVTVMGCGK